MTVKALVVHPNGSGEMVDMDTTYEGPRDIVGGDLQMVLVEHPAKGHTDDIETVMLCNENGMGLGLSANPKASQLMDALGAPVGDIPGDVLFVGSGEDPDVDAGFADLDDEVPARARLLGIL